MRTRLASRPNHLTTAERVAIAKARMSRVIDHVLHVLALHETNEIVNYSDVLAKQIPPTRAGHAFNLFQDALFRFEVIRLCSVWDRDSSFEHESIPTVIELVHDRSVVLALMRETCGHWVGRAHLLTGLSDDPELAALEKASLAAHEDQFGRVQAVKVGRGLLTAIKAAREVIASDDLNAMRNWRNKQLAHGLNRTREEIKVGPVRSMRYGEEGRLLDRTLEIAQKLYCCVNGTSLDLEESRQIDRRQAEALWNGCKFTPLE